MPSFICKRIMPVLLFTTAIVSMSSCKKSDDDYNDFTWGYGNNNYTANFKAAYLQSISAYPLIIAGTGTSITTPGTNVKITLDSFTTGSYSFASSVANTVTYYDDLGNTLSALTGSLTITDDSDNKLSGNFSAVLTNSVQISGSFVNIPVSP